jgi:hypothetical protein
MPAAGGKHRDARPDGTPCRATAGADFIGRIKPS